MTDAFQLDDPDEYDDDAHEGAYLRISRDATADDMAAFMPDKTPDERAAFLDDLRSNQDAVVTLTVTTMVPVTTVQAFGESVPVREITGLIIGPPGSEQFLRRPSSAPTGEHVNCEHDPIAYSGGAMICSPIDAGRARQHAGLGLPCTECAGPCTIDEVGDGE